MRSIKLFAALTIFIMPLVGCGETPHTHRPGEEVRENEVPASCLNAGSYDLVTYCLDCKEEVSRETKPIAPLGHDINQVAAKPATCTEDGYDAYEYCSRCDYTTKVVAHATGHQHTAQRHDNEVPAGCLSDGSYDLVTYCADCGYVISSEHKVTPALGHDIHQVEAKQASCTENGYQSYEYCSRCDYSTKVIIPTTGHIHTEVKRENELPAGCETSGSYEEVIYCVDCKEELSRETKSIAPLGHDIHQVEAKPVSCTEDGYDAYEYCSRCDYSTQEIIHATGHLHTSTRNDNVVEAGCESEGSYDLVTYCTDCEAVLNTEHKTIEATGHNYEKVSSTPATLDYDGYDTYECSNCHDTYDEKTEDKITDPIKYEEGRYYDWFTEDYVNGYKVVGYYGEPEELIVPATHEGKRVIAVESTAFQWCTSVKKIDIANNITIGNWAFKGCSNLEELCVQYATTNLNYATYYTSASIYAKTQFGTYFGEEEYENSYKISQSWNWADTYYSYIPNSLKKLTIRSSTLYNACTGLKSLEEISVRAVGVRGFGGCSNIKKITFLDDVYLYPEAFAGCTSVETIIVKGLVKRNNSTTEMIVPAVNEVILDDSVTGIYAYSFYGFPMKTLRMSPNVTYIDGYAFYNNANLIEIEIPEALETMGGYNFYNCPALHRVIYRATNAKFTFDAMKQYSMVPFKGSNITEIYIASNVQFVEDKMFTNSPYIVVNLSGLNNFYVADKGTYNFTEEGHLTYEVVDDCAIYTIEGKKILTRYFGDSDTFEVPNDIDDAYRFLIGNTSVKTLTIRNNIKVATNYFIQSSSLETLYLDVETLEANSIYNCGYLKNVTFGTSLTTIKNSAIFGCYNFTSITYEGTIEQWNGIDIGSYWYPYTLKIIHCIDGDISIQ